MSQLFHPRSNAFARASIFGALFALAAILGLYALFIRSPYVTDVGVVRDQPVPFSHQHHVGGLGIDCRYCHAAVETAAYAGMPAVHTCMSCHSQVWTDAPALAPIRTAYRENRPIAWQRVYDLPDFVYFDHSIHVAKGVGCETCHGRIDQMPLTWQAVTLHMEWCLDCHRRPAAYLRPQSEIFTMGYEPQPSQAALGADLVAANAIALPQLDDCSICHR
ncbi:MAG: cytochrome c3 family protein [Anaerolineales bacterium]|nr:cytochrome c3 family protein [Anaerolineales bacterium]